MLKKREGFIASHSVLLGFPHPSGGNGHRHRQFSENKDEMKKLLQQYFSN